MSYLMSYFMSEQPEQPKRKYYLARMVDRRLEKLKAESKQQADKIEEQAAEIKELMIEVRQGRIFSGAVIIAIVLAAILGVIHISKGG